MILFVLLFNLKVCASSDQQLCDYFVVLPKDIERLIIDEYIVKNDTDFRDIKVGLTCTNKFWYKYTLTKNGGDTLQNCALKQKIRRRWIGWLCNTSFDKIIDLLGYSVWYFEETDQVRQRCRELPNYSALSICNVALEYYETVFNQWENFMQLHRNALEVPDVNHVILCERNTNEYEYEYHTCLPDALEETLIQIDTRRKKIIKLILPGIDYGQYLRELAYGQVPVTHRIYGEQRSGKPFIKFFNKTIRLLLEGKIAILEKISDFQLQVKLSDIVYALLKYDMQSGYQRFIPKSLQYKALISNFVSLGQTPLKMAVARSDYETVRQLLQHGEDPNKKYISEKFLFYITPLYCAMRSGSVDIVKLLLRYRANPNMPIYSGETPIMIAANGKIELIQVLLDAGADVNAKDYTGRTPLYYAICFKNDEIITLLLKSGADILMPLKYARKNRIKSAILILESLLKLNNNDISGEQ